MAYRVELTRAAERDRDNVLSYILDHACNPDAAASFFGDLYKVLEKLREFPLMYPESKDPRLLRLAYRKALFGSYLALYRIVDATVVVARIFHQHQDYAKLV